MLRILAILLLFVLAGPHPWTARRTPAWNNIQQIVATPIALPVGRFGPLEVLEAWHLTSPHSGFGGWSAMALTGEREFLLLGDAGHMTRFALTADGRTRDVRIMPLIGQHGHGKGNRDAEAAFRDPDTGQIWAAFEGGNRITRLDAGLTRIERQVRPWEMRRWSANGGPEAMTRLNDGRWLVLAERAEVPTLGTAGILFSGDPTLSGPENHVRFGYQSWGMGLVTDAATLPDGRVLLLHRQISPWRWFTSTLAIGDPAQIVDRQSWTATPLASIGQPGLSDNFEAIAIAPHPRGISIWLATDNNFTGMQRSLLVHLLLPWDALPPR